jgi:hypothetical protein
MFNASIQRPTMLSEAQASPRSLPGDAAVPNAAPAVAPLPRRRPDARPPVAPRTDTTAWRVQVWASFAIALLLCGTGVYWLPGAELERAFVLMGVAFGLCSATALAKHVRDNQHRESDTPAYKVVVWGGFALAMTLTGWGLQRLDISPAYSAFLGVSWLYLITSTFTLAKTLRDQHEDRLAERAE